MAQWRDVSISMPPLRADARSSFSFVRTPSRQDVIAFSATPRLHVTQQPAFSAIFTSGVSIYFTTRFRQPGFCDAPLSAGWSSPASTLAASKQQQLLSSRRRERHCRLRRAIAAPYNSRSRRCQEALDDDIMPAAGRLSRHGRIAGRFSGASITYAAAAPALLISYTSRRRRASAH